AARGRRMRNRVMVVRDTAYSPTKTSCPTQTQHSQSSMVHSLGVEKQNRRRPFTDQVGEGGDVNSSVTTIGTMLEGSSKTIEKLATCFQFLAD
ncbi:hypothetical protein COLO4_38398, partial [Corchorus olitorius]